MYAFRDEKDRLIEFFPVMEKNGYALKLYIDAKFTDKVILERGYHTSSAYKAIDQLIQKHNIIKK